MSTFGKIIIFGGSGGLGTALNLHLAANFSNHSLVSLSSKDVDIKDMNQITDLYKIHNPNIIINLAVKNIDSLIHTLDPLSVNEQIAVNILGNINIIKAAIPIMRQNNYGRIIYISSILSKHPLKGTSIYSGCKAFNDNFIRTCAIENAKYHITANSIQLGYFEHGLSERVPKDIMEKVNKTIPLQRLGKIEELLNALIFLINTEYATGLNMTLAGGLEC